MRDTCLSTRSGGSAHCLHCPHVLEPRRTVYSSSGGSAHCLHSRAFYRKRTLMNAPSNSVCFQFRLMMLLWSVCIVHTFWRLNALFAARANGGYSCPQALEETQADIVAFCREHVIANALDECSLQFRLFPVPFDETSTRVSICEYPTNPWGTMMRLSIIVCLCEVSRDFIGG